MAFGNCNKGRSHTNLDSSLSLCVVYLFYYFWPDSPFVFWHFVAPHTPMCFPFISATPSSTPPPFPLPHNPISIPLTKLFETLCLSKLSILLLRSSTWMSYTLLYVSCLPSNYNKLSITLLNFSTFITFIISFLSIYLSTTIIHQKWNNQPSTTNIIL